MPVVTMPDGVDVSFPDTMPPEQIRSMIATKFPDAVAKQATAPKPATKPTTPLAAGINGAAKPDMSIAGVVAGAMGVGLGGMKARNAQEAAMTPKVEFGKQPSMRALRPSDVANRPYPKPARSPELQRTFGDPEQQAGIQQIMATPAAYVEAAAALGTKITAISQADLPRYQMFQKLGLHKTAAYLRDTGEEAYPATRSVAREDVARNIGKAGQTFGVPQPVGELLGRTWQAEYEFGEKMLKDPVNVAFLSGMGTLKKVAPDIAKAAERGFQAMMVHGSVAGTVQAIRTGELSYEDGVRLVLGWIMAGLPEVGHARSRAALRKATKTAIDKGLAFRAQAAPRGNAQLRADIRSAVEGAIPKKGEVSAIQERQSAPVGTHKVGGEGVGRKVEGSRVGQGVEGQEVTGKGQAQAQAAQAVGPASAISGYPIVEFPTDRIVVHKDIPNFKGEADPVTGVIPGEQLEGGYQRLGTGPIVLWEKLNGETEIVTGRHRLDLARRNGEVTIPSQVVREADGFTKHMALLFDAEANIRDGKGSVKDYARFFAGSEAQYNEGVARQRGLLASAKGRAGWDIGRNASPDVRSLYVQDKITEQQAVAIARAAPGDAEAQHVGAQYALKGRDPAFVGNLIKAVQSQPKGVGQEDLFGGNDAALRAAEAQAERAGEIQKSLRERLSAVAGASKRPELASKLGVDVRDKDALAAEVARIRAELQRWDKWPMHSDLVAQTRGEAVSPSLTPAGGDLFAEPTPTPPAAPTQPAPTPPAKAPAPVQEAVPAEPVPTAPVKAPAPSATGPQKGDILGINGRPSTWEYVGPETAGKGKAAQPTGKHVLKSTATGKPFVVDQAKLDEMVRAGKPAAAPEPKPTAPKVEPAKSAEVAPVDARAKLKSAADAARERIRKSTEFPGETEGPRPIGSGLSDQMLKDYAVIAADFMVDKAYTFGAFSKRMVSEFGESVKPHLQAIWAAAHKELGKEPPAERKRTPVAKSSGDVTGVAKAVTGREPQQGRTVEGMLERGQEAVTSGRINPTAVSERTMKSGKPMSDEELAAVGYRLRQIENERAAITGDIAKTSDPAELQTLNEAVRRADAETENLLSSADLTLNRGFHRLGMAAQIVLDKTYSLRDLPHRAKAALMGTEAPKDMQAKLDTFQSENFRLQSELKAARLQLEKALQERAQKQAQSRPEKQRARDIDTIRKYFGQQAGTITGPGLKSRQAGAVSYTIPEEQMQAMQAMRRLARDLMQDTGSFDGMMKGLRDVIGKEVPDETIYRMLSDTYRKSMLEADVNRLHSQRYLRDLQAGAEYRLKNPAQKAMHVADELFNTTTRSLKAGMDASAPFLQGRKGLFANPTGWLKSWGPMLQAFAKGDIVPDQMMADIQAHPMYARSRAAKLELTEVGGSVTKQEEMFRGNLVRAVEHYLDTGPKAVRLVGKPVRLYLHALSNTEAGWTAFLNKLRWDTFVKLAQAAPDDPAYLHDVAGTINTIYGRGASNFARALGSSPHASKAFFAPRYAVSSWEYALGRPILSAETSRGRTQAFKIYAIQAAAYGGLLAMARLAGWDVDLDTRSTDLGRVEVPVGGGKKVKFDLFTREAQAWRLMSNLAYGKISRSNKFTPPSGYNAASSVGQYLRGKAAPLPAAALNIAFGKLQEERGGKFTARSYNKYDLASEFMPLWVTQGIQDGTFKEMPVLSIAAIVGEDVQPGEIPTRKEPFHLTKPGIFRPKSSRSKSMQGMPSMSGMKGMPSLK